MNENDLRELLTYKYPNGNWTIKENDDGTWGIDEWNEDDNLPSIAEAQAAFIEYSNIKKQNDDERIRKYNRDNALNVLKITTAAGNTFDADEKSQERMARAILILQDGESTMWKLADNSIKNISKIEMKEALKLAGQAQTALWFSSNNVVNSVDTSIPQLTTINIPQL